MAKIEIKNLSFFYPNQATAAVNGVSLTIESGQFFTICGPSGCGKTTLLRNLKPCIAPYGRRCGEILIDGIPAGNIGALDQSRLVGYVGQSPENQIVTDKVWHELAFGLQNIGMAPPEIRQKVAETASFFGIQNWFRRDTASLSGGQKQLLNLASVMVAEPEILVLDEPLSQLDPIAASEFLGAVERVNRELGTTVVITEQRLEEVLPMSDAAAVMDAGRIIVSASVSELGERLKRENRSLISAMPSPMRVWALSGGRERCPVTVRDGRAWLERFGKEKGFLPLKAREERALKGKTLIEAEGVYFRYEKGDCDTVRNLALKVKSGDFLAVLGGNGTGKTTALKLLAGIYEPQRGKILRRGKIGYLPQDTEAVFLKKTVKEDLLDVIGGAKSEESSRKILDEAVRLCRLEGLLERHPYDLSGGQKQRAALAKVLLTGPDILLLDEPTKGMDSGYKKIFGKCLRELAAAGAAIVLVSHDVEFCACYAGRCGMFFDGEIINSLTPERFFTGSSFYTTAAARMAKNLIPGAVTAEDIIYACTGETEDHQPEDGPGDNGGVSERPDGAEETDVEYKPEKRAEPSGRGILGACMILFLIPLTLLLCTKYIDGRKYLITSLLVLLEAMAPFFMIFESRRPQAREIVVAAVMCAAAVAGRAVFFMVPEFKPVMALTIISGAALGCETGFMVGAMSMLVSNMIFSQGVWTPWQMFAMGITGFLAGLIFYGRRAGIKKVALCVFGGFCAVFIYGGIMNPASALMWMQEINAGVLLATYASGLPVDLVHAAATVLFLWFISEPMIEKIDRIRVKYGILR